MSSLDRDEIAEAAAELFAARSYASVSVADIVERLDCTPPRLYRRFPSKSALLHAILDAAVADLAYPGGNVDEHVAAALGAAVLRPAFVVTYVTDRRWFDPVEFGDIAQRAEAYDRGWRAAIAAATERLPERSLALRQRAVEAIVRVVASTSRSSGAARVRDALAIGLVALVEAPPVQYHADVSEPRPWIVPLTRRQEILDAAIALIGARGFADVRVDDVGEAVGIAGPSIFQHFATKQEILVAAFDRGVTQLMISAHSAIEGADDAPDALHRLAHGLASSATRNRALFRMLLNESGWLNEPDRNRILKLRRDYDEVWASVITQTWSGLGPTAARTIARAGVDAVFSGLEDLDVPYFGEELAVCALAFIDGAATASDDSPPPEHGRSEVRGPSCE